MSVLRLLNKQAQSYKFYLHSGIRIDKYAKGDILNTWLFIQNVH